MADYRIRAMNRNEVDWAVGLAAKEGWNPGLHDAGCFYETDPQGFLVGLLDGQPIGCISAVSYAGTFGFLGFYIVLPEYRGKGYGIQLWHAAMEKLARHNVGLDGVVAQQDNYRKSGFKFAYSNIRYESLGTGEGVTAPNLVSLGRLPFDQVEQYDRDFFPAPRTTFLQNWFALPDSTALAWLDDSQIKGMGMIRKCGTGHKIGPLYADNPDIAGTLFEALAGSVARSDPVYLDVPEVNASAMALAERRGMKRVFETARMYTGGFPKLNIDKLYGVTSFELG